MSATAFPARKVSNNPPAPSQAGPGAWCSFALLYLLGGGLLWLVAALVLGFLATLKFHAPGLLAADGFWSYGRVHAAAESSLLYGFGVQAALGVGLWLLCRLGRTMLTGPFAIAVATFFWNLAVTVGVICILCGNNTGYDEFQMPAICAPTLFLSFAIIGICGILTFHQRSEGPLYPSQWFVIGSIFWFPWIFSTAAILLLLRPVQGVVQPAIAWWYAHNLSTVFLGFAGLASTLYFIPKLLGRPLYSRQLAGLTFWGLALFGSCGGIPDGAPLPSWVASLAVIGSVFMVIPMLALGDNLRHTVRQQAKPLDADPTLRFTYAGVAFLFIAVAQQIVGALPHVSQITSLTWYGVAQKEFLHLGFFAMTIFGAMYYIVPRLLGLEASAWCPKLAKWHFILSVAGILISGLSLMVAGIQQGILLSEPGHSFVDVMQSTLMPLRMSTLGDLFFLAGACNFLANFTGCVGTSCRQWCAKLKEAG